MSELAELTRVADSVSKLGDLFNGDDLDKLMEGFADDAVFQSVQGQISRGKAAIKVAFAPMYDGTLGKVHFDWTETVIEEAAGKALVAWTLSLTRDGKPVKVRGVDVFLFENGLVKSKNTYGKAAAMLPE